MSEMDLYTKIRKNIQIGEFDYHVDTYGIELVCIEYDQRIADLERNNEILAEQLKKRDGMWLAPIEPDRKMVEAANGLLKLGSFIVTGNEYKVMRDNWLGRQK